MKRGDEFDCPYCGENTFLKQESILDTAGWGKIGEALFCASCSEKIEDISDVEKKESLNSSSGDLSMLSDLLGTKPEENVRLQEEFGDTHFCKDCKHFIVHPFMDRCSFHDKTVNPMDDCENYIKRD
jgi:DNA-directed RNA polymerase subunit RPC12/RpoP